jgi:CHAT domain-containing protein
LLILLYLLCWQSPDPGTLFEACRQSFPDQAQVYQGADCFYRLGKSQNQYDQAEKELKALLENQPDLPWVYFYLGRIAQDTGKAEADQHYQQALELFAAAQDVSGQVYSLINLARLAANRGDFDAELNALEGAEAIARQARKTRLSQTVALDRTDTLERAGRFRQAERSLLALEADIFASTTFASKFDWILKMISLTVTLGQPERAQQLRNRLETLIADRQELRFQLTAGYVAMMIDEHFENWEAPQKVATDARALLDLAEANQAWEISIQMRYLLGKLEGADHLQKALQQARDLNLREREAQLLVAMAAHGPATDSQTKLEYLQQAYAIWAELDLPSALLESIDDLNAAFDQLKPASQSLLWREALIDVVEAIRSWQNDEISRAGFLSRWSLLYYQPAGAWLRQEQPNHERAFNLMERLRARTMRESMMGTFQSAGGNRSKSPVPLAKLLAHLNPELVLPNTTALREELQMLQSSENDVDTLHSLSEVQATLSANEALLSYQLGRESNLFGQPQGGSWLQVITRETVQTLPIAQERDKLTGAIRVYRDLLRDPNQQAWADRGGAQLAKLLIEEALTKLPETVDHLILIPDAALHTLAFEALPIGEEALPLGIRYQLSQVPSASLWLSWRKQQVPSQQPAALILANSGETRSPLPEAFAESRIAALPVLEQAVNEGQTILNFTGEASRLFIEDQATESILKQAVNFPVVHFAAHAVVDDSMPQASAIVLASSEDSDGYLFPDEIAQLDLQDKVVVLSTCQSASGYLLYGEGPLSLARAFMQAGARAVIGTLWPINDADANQFFSLFYQQLMAGQSLATAAQQTRQLRASQDAQVAAWAGVVVLGDGDFAPFKKPSQPWLQLTIIVGLALAFSIWLLRQFRAGRNTP